MFHSSFYFSGATASFLANNCHALTSTYVSKRAMSSCGADIRASIEGNKPFEGLNVEGAIESLAKADAVCFDVDSTVIQEEGIVSRPFSYDFKLILCQIYLIQHF